MNAPEIDYLALSPMLVVLLAAVVGVLVETFVPRAARHVSQVALSYVAIAGAFALVVWQMADGAAMEAGTPTAIGSVMVDGPTLFLQATILVLAAVSLLVYAERRVDVRRDAFAPSAAALPGSLDEQVLTRRGVLQTEVYPLTLFAIGGMLLFPASNDLITMFIALEVLSLPLYLLSATARRRRLLSQEAALKYFLLGAFSSAIFIFGAAFVYGYSGSLELSGIDTGLSSTVGQDPLLLTGVGLMAVALLFKIGAAPFHAWTPDVYQGAPTPVTGFMAACTKLAAFGALLRLFYVAFGGVRTDWEPMLWAVAILTMLVGSLAALTQTDIKRILAYSSVAHAGFALTGVVAADEAGTAGVLFYLAVYGIATIGAFAVVTLVRDAGGEATGLERWAGLGQRSPLLAGSFALFLLSFAGIPLTSGFVGKLTVFTAALGSGAAVLVVIGVLASAIAAFFYVRIIVVMFFTEPAADGPEVVTRGVLTNICIGIAVVATIVLGVYPAPLLELAQQAATFVR